MSTPERVAKAMNSALAQELFGEGIYMMRKLATIGACAIILLGSTGVPANAKGGSAGGGASFGTGGHAGGASGHAGGASGHAGGNSGQSNDVGGHGGPVGFANGQFAPNGTPPCQPGVCPGRSQ
jgi:hypothetical protein